MTSFTRRVLKRLDSIWRFVGGVQGLSDMNLEGSVQPVVDLSRQAELGSGLGASAGYFMRGESIVFVGGGGTTRRTLDPWTSVDAFEPERSKASMWLMGCWAQHNSRDIEEGGISLTMPQVGDGSLLSNVEMLLAYWTGEVPRPVTSAGIFPMTAVLGPLTTVTAGQANMAIHSPLPMNIPAGSTLNFMGHAVAGGVITLTCLLWAGAAGARPPGVA